MELVRFGLVVWFLKITLQPMGLVGSRQVVQRFPTLPGDNGCLQVPRPTRFQPATRFRAHEDGDSVMSL